MIIMITIIISFSIMLMLISMLFMFICTFINSNYWLTCAMHWKVLYKDDKTNYIIPKLKTVQYFSRMQKVS